MQNKPSASTRYWRVLRVGARRGLSNQALVCVLIIAALVSIVTVPTLGETFGLVSFGLNVAMALALSVLSLKLAATQRQLQTTSRKLLVAEEQFARVLNFNSANFDDKANLIELTLNHMNQGVAVMRPDGRIWLYNQRALEYAGVEDPPFPPTMKGIFEIQLRNQEFGPDLELLPPEIKAFFFEGKGKPPKSYIRKRPNGTILEVRSDPMPDGSIIQTYTDITELALAKEAAEAAARAKANFLATMSHEIRTPLNGVIVAGKILLDTQLSDDQRRYVETITSCGEALLVVINDILDFSKFESAGVELDETVCQPERIFQSAVLVTKSSAELKGLEIIQEGLEHLPPAMIADAKRLRQVLINFIGNAVKFTEAGRITVRVETLHDKQKPLLRASVIDTGIGIKDESLDRLFKEFSQVDNSIARRFGGTGLGLAICRRLIDGMGGRIGVKSRYGEGSEFWFEIPLRVAQLPASQQIDVKALARRHGSLRILVAEDVPTNQLVITGILKKLGHKIDIAENGQIALDRLQAGSYDLVMLDMQMPVMDGLEASRRIRQLGGHYATLPIIAVTANAFASDREACFAAGMNGFVTKPFEPDEIFAEIARVADAAHGTRIARSERRQPSLDIDETRLHEIFHYTSAQDAREIVECFAEDAAALFARLNMKSGEGAQRDLMTALKGTRDSCIDLGLRDAARSCEAYMFRLAEESGAAFPPPPRLQKDIDAAVEALRSMIIERDLEQRGRVTN